MRLRKPRPENPYGKYSRGAKLLRANRDRGLGKTTKAQRRSGR